MFICSCSLQYNLQPLFHQLMLAQNCCKHVQPLLLASHQQFPSAPRCSSTLCQPLRAWPSQLASTLSIQCQAGSHCRRPAPRQRHVCRAGPEKASVVELLWLLKAKSDADPEQIEVLLDSLWSLQYMVPAGILCAAAGPVVSCTTYPCATQQLQQLMSAEQQQQPKGQWQCGFTHAVHFRLANRLKLEHLMAHPLMASSRDAVAELCTDHAQLVFEGMVTKRLEALFRRGEEFESGVEHILLLQPGANGGLGADDFLSQLAGLAESSVAGGIQASHGAVISCVHAAATHVLMVRFAAPQQVQQLLGTPACAAVIAADPRVPVVAVASLSISIQPTEDSTQVAGGSGGAGLGRPQ